MHHRILVPQGRGRRPANMAQVSASPDYYAALSQLAAGSGGNEALAQYAKYLSAANSNTTAAAATGSSSSGSSSYGTMTTMNPMYAAALQQYQSMIAAANLGKGDADKEPSEQQAVEEKEAAEAMASMSSFPFIGYNPMMMNQLYAQSVAAANMSSLAHMQSLMNGMQATSSTSATAVATAAAIAAASKKDGANIAATLSKAALLSTGKASDSAVVKSAKDQSRESGVVEAGIDLTMKKALATPLKNVSQSNDSTSPHSTKGTALENIVQDLSLKKVQPEEEEEG